MRLKDKSVSPAYGWYYEYTDGHGHNYEVRNGEGSLDSLIAAVRTHMLRNNVTPTDDLAARVEDQICSRQPPGKCFYESKAGDRVAQVAHVFAGGVDKAAKALGLPSPNLEKKARGCRTCAERRARLNAMSKK